MWQCSEIWLGTANFLTAEVTVWTNVKVARPFLLRPGNKARKMYNDCDHTVTIAVMFWLKGIVIVLELTLMLKLWVLLSPCWPPSLASTVVSIMWCHVMCALMGANYEVVAYEQPGREASCELVDAVHMCWKVRVIKTSCVTRSAVHNCSSKKAGALITLSNRGLLFSPMEGWLRIPLTKPENWA